MVFLIFTLALHQIESNYFCDNTWTWLTNFGGRKKKKQRRNEEGIYLSKTVNKKPEHRQHNNNITAIEHGSKENISHSIISITIIILASYRCQFNRYQLTCMRVGTRVCAFCVCFNWISSHIIWHCALVLISKNTQNVLHNSFGAKTKMVKNRHKLIRRLHRRTKMRDIVWKWKSAGSRRKVFACVCSKTCVLYV